MDRYQATLGTRRSLGREFLAEGKRKRGKERRKEKEEKRGEKRVEVWKRIRVTSVFRIMFVLDKDDECTIKGQRDDENQDEQKT